MFFGLFVYLFSFNVSQSSSAVPEMSARKTMHNKPGSHFEGACSVSVSYAKALNLWQGCDFSFAYLLQLVQVQMENLPECG